MNRRIWLLSLTASTSASALLPARAQPAHQARIGWLSTGPHPFIKDFRQGLGELDYREGRDVSVEERYAYDKAERLPALASELVAMKVDVIVASGAIAGSAARRATATIPIVVITNDPVASRLVQSLARPGGNVTGLAIMSGELAFKWVELLHEAFPALSRIAILRDASAAADTTDWPRVDAAVAALGVTLLRLDVRHVDEYESAFVSALGQGAQGMVLLSSPVFAAQRARLVALAASHRLPAMYEHGDFVEAGGLMSYGPNLHDVFRKAATYVDRILKGAKPADLPVQQPTRFELVLNTRAAAVLGVRFSPSIRLRADRVIE